MVEEAGKRSLGPADVDACLSSSPPSRQHTLMKYIFKTTKTPKTDEIHQNALNLFTIPRERHFSVDLSVLSIHSYSRSPES